MKDGQKFPSISSIPIRRLTGGSVDIYFSSCLEKNWIKTVQEVGSRSSVRTMDHVVITDIEERK